MAATVPTTEPLTIRAGDTWAWRRENLSDYPASLWTLTYYFRNSAEKFDVEATADGDLFAVSVPIATTAAIAAGSYGWLAVVDNTTERYEVGTGRLTVLPDLAADLVADTRSFARTMLEAVESALLNKASTSQLDLVQAALADRSMQYDTASLITLRSKLWAEVRREESTLNGESRMRILARFV